MRRLPALLASSLPSTDICRRAQAHACQADTACRGSLSELDVQRGLLRDGARRDRGVTGTGNSHRAWRVSAIRSPAGQRPRLASSLHRLSLLFRFISASCLSAYSKVSLLRTTDKLRADIAWNPRLPLQTRLLASIHSPGFILSSTTATSPTCSSCFTCLSAYRFLVFAQIREKHSLALSQASPTLRPVFVLHHQHLVSSTRLSLTALSPTCT